MVGASPRHDYSLFHLFHLPNSGAIQAVYCPWSRQGCPADAQVRETGDNINPFRIFVVGEVLPTGTLVQNAAQNALAAKVIQCWAHVSKAMWAKIILLFEEESRQIVYDDIVKLHNRTCNVFFHYHLKLFYKKYSVFEFLIEFTSM